MCGIIAVKGDDVVADVISGLKRLEYRGYDSCGISYKSNNKIVTHKRVGYVDNLQSINVSGVKGIAIGHTRWATHGSVSEINSHPHLSGDGNFSIVHNGIIENYKELCDKYLKDVKLSSNTDSEVIAHLISVFYEGDVWEAFRIAVSKLSGSYSIVMINNYNNVIYFARSGSPLVIGKNDKEYYLASDTNGLGKIKQICYIDDNIVGYIDNKVHVYDINCNKLKLKWHTTHKDMDMANRGKYSHYMIKEIYDIPSALYSCKETFDKIHITLPSVIKRIMLIGCGTSYHSALLGKKYIEELVGIPVECEIASEYIYNSGLDIANTLSVFISQSGETADTITALRKSKEKGEYTLAITNVKGSTISQIADDVIYLNAGAEICVASTKAYTNQVLSLLLLSNVLINLQHNVYDFMDGLVYVDGSLSKDYIGISDDEWKKLFAIDVSQVDVCLNDIARRLSKCRELYLIGKDHDYITAKEGALKIKEVTYIFTDDYFCGELKHGTLSLIDIESVVIVVSTNTHLVDKVKNAINEIVARGGKVIVISQLGNWENNENNLIKIPNVHRLLMPIVSIIPIDLIAYKVSIIKGINPDKPRNLAKSVTVE